MRGFLKDKKKRSAFFLGVSFLVAGGAFALPSLAWLAKAQVNAPLDGLKGEARGAYFNGGDGSAEAPFEIDNPRQLYYFNWLQDLGYFNNPNDDKTAINQTYFILTSDIDCSDYILPPAGTKKYPFVGNFNGNGKTISNVTITNSFSDFKAVPNGATSDDDGILEQAEIVGFFGVVGSTSEDTAVNSYSYDSSILEIKNLGFDNATIESSSSSTLVGLAAGYVNGKLSGVGINNSSILTKEDASPISGIAGVNNISEYSLVGFATEEYRSKTQVNDEVMSIPQITNPNTAHGSTNWGGSVDMKQMYTDLKSEQSDTTITQDVYFTESESIDVDPNGVESDPYNIVPSTDTKKKAVRYESGSTAYYFKNGERKDDGKTVASYGITTSSGYDDNYVFIYGTPDEVPTSDSKSNVTMTVTRNTMGYLTSISKGGHYLAISEGPSLSDTTDSSLAAGWTVPGDGSSSRVSSIVDGTTYYLNLNGTDGVVLSTSATTTWVYSSSKGNLYTLSGQYAYYLDYDSTNGWGVVQAESTETYLTIVDSTSSMYVGYSGSGSSLIASSSISDTASYAWGYDSSKGAYYPLSNSGLYLSIQRIRSNNKSTFSPILSSQESTGSTAVGFCKMSSVSSDGTGSGTMKASITGSQSSYTAYLYYGSSSFLASTDTSSHSFTVSKIGGGAEVETGLSFGQSDKTGVKEVSTTNSAATYYVNPTYVPLAYSYDDSDEKTGINGVSQMNTGYLVGGANFDSSSDYAGDIRVAKAYEMSSLDTSFNGTSNSKYNSASLQVLTRASTKNEDGAYVDEGWSRIIDTYNSGSSASKSIDFSGAIESSTLQRYDSARKNLQYTLFGTYSESATAATSDPLYGLHFMNATISTSHLCKVGKAIVYDKKAEAAYQAELKDYLDGKTDTAPTQTGSVYIDYDVPEDSINFNLATEGYINFFGGSYFTGNESFFSLNEIARDEENNITDIKEIKKVYANTGDDAEENPYVYSYDDSVPANSDANHLVFDTSWITSPDMIDNCLYYFEIPVNAGEYALGSVTGKAGAYLLYLDIGTGAANYDSVTIDETTTSTIIKQSYPLGVDFTSSFSDLPSINGGSTACIAILVAPKKEIDYDYESDSSTLTAGPVSGLKAVFQNTEVTVSGSDGSIPSASANPTVVTMSRETIETFNPTNTTLTLAYSCTWTIRGASAGDAIQLYSSADQPVWTSGDSSIGTVSDTGLVTILKTGDLNITATGTSSKTPAAGLDWEGPEQIIKTGTFGEFKFSMTGSANVEYVYDEENDTYVVTIHSDVALSVRIIAIPTDASYKITINGTEVTAVDQLIEVSAESAA